MLPSYIREAGSFVINRHYLKLWSSTAAAAAAFVLLAGCSNNSSSGQATGDAHAAQDLVQTTPAPTASPTPVPTPNPDEAAGLIMHFYRDVDNDTTASYSDIGSIVTADFLRNHNDDWTKDYGYVSSPRVQVQKVAGRDVFYDMDYMYKGSSGRSLYWHRSGTWKLNHGRAGWLLDEDAWSSLHLVGFTTSPTSAMIPVKDRTFGDGHHEFDYQGLTYTFTATGKGWSMTAIVPSPPPGFDPSEPDSNSAADENEGSGESARPSGGSYVAPYAGAPQAPEARCQEVSVSDIYDDGKILDLDDGRKLAVADYDTPTSGVWVAPFDGLICNGDRFINKDDHEAVDLEY
jgi:hypothetical protein